jgi:hypothetical protein
MEKAIIIKIIIIMASAIKQIVKVAIENQDKSSKSEIKKEIKVAMEKDISEIELI